MRENARKKIEAWARWEKGIRKASESTSLVPDPQSIPSDQLDFLTVETAIESYCSNARHRAKGIYKPHLLRRHLLSVGLGSFVDTFDPLQCVRSMATEEGRRKEEEKAMHGLLRKFFMGYGVPLHDFVNARAEGFLAYLGKQLEEEVAA